MLTLYARARTKETSGVVKEFEIVLLGYLEQKLDRSSLIADNLINIGKRLIPAST